MKGLIDQPSLGRPIRDPDHLGHDIWGFGFEGECRRMVIADLTLEPGQ